MKLLVGPLLTVAWLFPTSAPADWSGPATAVYSKQAAPAPVLKSGMSPAEFNRHQASRDPHAFRLVSLTVHQEKTRARDMLDQRVEFAWQGHTFQGEVMAFFVGPSASDTQVLVRLQNRKQGQHWLLPRKALGTLSLSTQRK